MKALTLAIGATVLIAQPAFEVASVKPSGPQQQLLNGLFTYPGGRVTCSGCWLEYLIEEAFDVQEYQIAGAPDWKRDKFDLEAKPPVSSKSSGFWTSNAKLPPPPEEREMLRALLKERFRLEAHRETKQGTVFFLVRTRKPLKLTPAKDPDAFPWTGSPRNGMIRGDGVAGQNISMPLFAVRLSSYMERPVIDHTGLKGSFDFSFRYEGEPDRDVASSILRSVESLGLKLKSGKGPVETIVIDRVEKLTAN